MLVQNLTFIAKIGKDRFVAKVDARDYLQTGATVELGLAKAASLMKTEKQFTKILIKTLRNLAVFLKCVEKNSWKFQEV